MLNVVDGCIPSDLGTGTSAEIEEERRLLYVAVTRAKDDLHLIVPQPNKEVGLFHPKAMPVVLTAGEEIKVWMDAPAEEALKLQRIEPLSLDEAYLDVTENLKGIGSATQIAETLRAKIRTETGLTASAGISYNKFLAKLASDHRKPDGLFVITPKTGPAFVERLPVEKFHGVGPATAAKMNRLGIKTGFDLRGQTLAFLQQHFGKAGPYYYWIARGVDERPVRAADPQVSWCGKHLFRRYLHIRGRMRGAPADHRKGLAHLRGHRDSRAHGDTESEICRFPADHTKPDRSGAVFDASRNRAA